MKDGSGFWRSLGTGILSGCLGAILGSFILIVSLVTFVVISEGGEESSATEVANNSVLVLNLSANIVDGDVSENPFDLITSDQTDSLTLSSLIDSVNYAAKDKKISGLYITGNLSPSSYGTGFAQLTELREALQRFRNIKPVYAYNTSWERTDLMLVAGATNLYLNPTGTLNVGGLSAEPMFYGDAFRKYGIDVQVTRVGKYKSAVEPFITNRMSDASREQMEKLLNDLWSEWKLYIGKDRKKNEDELQELADTKGFLLANEALQNGMIDGIRNYDEVIDELKKLSGGSSKAKLNQVDISDYWGSVPDDKASKNKIALVIAQGEIIDGTSYDDNVIASGDLTRRLRKIRNDKNIKAVVLRVNSPGGSAVASDLIQREIRLILKDKPVVISMGNYAASGGYWISTYSSRIFAEPSTITGSIGVFGLLPNVKSLANSYGITWDSVMTSKLGSMTTPTRPKTPQELERLQVGVDQIYEDFINKVSESRKLKPEFVREIAQGRVWSGKEAIKLGLVDEFGGLDSAIAHAAKLAKIEKDYELEYPETRPPFLQRYLELFDGQPDPIATKGVARELKEQILHQYRILNLMNDPRNIYARLPYEVVVR